MRLFVDWLTIMKTILDWTKECKYIAGVTALKGDLPEFNNDKHCFIRYCVMQRNAAMKQRFFDSAEYIQQCIDELQCNETLTHLYEN